jgi:hypothetical protein
MKEALTQICRQDFDASETDPVDSVIGNDLDGS